MQDSSSGCTGCSWGTSLPNIAYCKCRAPDQVNPEFGSQGPHTDREAPQVPTALPAWLQQTLNRCFSFDISLRPSVVQLHQVRGHRATCMCPAVDGRIKCKSMLMAICLHLASLGYSSYFRIMVSILCHLYAHERWPAYPWLPVCIPVALMSQQACR